MNSFFPLARWWPVSDPQSELHVTSSIPHQGNADGLTFSNLHSPAALLSGYEVRSNTISIANYNKTSEVIDYLAKMVLRNVNFVKFRNASELSWEKVLLIRFLYR